ncbi:MAG TPA: hypothetical protein VGK84_12120 [Candidatus Tumulicola sp.]
MLTPIALVFVAVLTGSARSATDECATFRTWFAGQPGSQLVVSSTNYFNQKFASPRKRDNILDYSPMPSSNDRTSWYKAMKHFRTSVGSGRCFSAFYDPNHKTALVLSEYGTGSDLTITTISNAPSGIPVGKVPSQTQNGVRLGMTLAQVRAIDGAGTLRSQGHRTWLSYNQDVKKTPNIVFTGYLGFLFVDGKLVAADVGGGI